MNLHRIIVGLLQPLLALLLMAGLAQAEPRLFEDNDRQRMIESSLGAVGDSGDRADHVALAIKSTHDRADDFHDPGPALPASEIQIALDQARLSEKGCAAYPTAPRSHRPCAAPSTGPPLV